MGGYSVRFRTFICRDIESEVQTCSAQTTHTLILSECRGYL